MSIDAFASFMTHLQQRKSGQFEFVRLPGEDASHFDHLARMLMTQAADYKDSVTVRVDPDDTRLIQSLTIVVRT